MNKFSKGFFAGSLIGIAGLAYAMKDKRTRRSIMRDGRKMAEKASDTAHNISDMF